VNERRDDLEERSEEQEALDAMDEFERLLEDDPEAALEEALAWVAEEPDSPEAHYAAGSSYEALERPRQQIQHFLEVLRLDAEDDARLGEPIADYERIIADEVESTLSELPPVFRERLGAVTILIEPRPSSDLVREGWDPRLLGFFEGATAEQMSGPDAPPVATRILIFSHNLAATFEDEQSLREEVAVTVLHEVGHFFGLDEDDMDRLGLA
jgi:predicted Zn-dependent protease with MMP-like domain